MENFLREAIIDTTPPKVNWDFINTIPEFEILNHCEQNPKWHGEGNVMNHIKLAYEEFHKHVLTFGVRYSLSDMELLIIHAAILLHDIGKSTTTSLGKDGNWHAYGHEVEGEKIARVLLWDEDMAIREEICSLIRYHMEPLRIFESKNWIHRIIEIGSRVSWKMLYYVKMADLLGSIQHNGGTKKEDLMKLELVKQAAQSLGVWHKKSQNEHEVLLRYGKNTKYLPWKVDMKPDKKAYILIGLPGAGKDKFVNDKILLKHPDAVHISRDIIRTELGFCGEGEKYLGTQEEENKVTEIFDKQLNDAINKSKVIILNNMNIKRKYRDVTNNLLRNKGYKITYIYVEAPTLEHNYKRRDGQILPEVIKKIALAMDFPEPIEYETLIIEKQTH